MPNSARRSLRAATLLAVAALVLPTVPSAGAATSPAAAADELLIRFTANATPAERRAVERAYGLTKVRGDAKGRNEVVQALGRSPAAVARRLAQDPAILAVAPNHRRALALDPAAEPAFPEEWGLHNTGQAIDGTEPVTGTAGVDIDGVEALRYGLGSPKVVVAVIDDGVDFSHPDLAARAWTNPGEAGALAANGIDDDGNGYVDDVNGWDFCNNDNSLHDAGQDGHGTHVAGTIAASLNGKGVVGVAPGIQVMALKFLDDSGLCGWDAMAVEAIDYAASFGVRIINASWGGEDPSTVLDAAIGSSGALFVAAAGNNGENMDAPGGVRFYPAASTKPNVIAVAAIDQKGRLADFSNYGSKSVDLGAPGTNILSSWPASRDCPSPCYAWSAGTSMAAPHVSGVAALAGSQRPSLLADPIALRARLLSRGRAMTATTGLTATGRMVNAWRAVDFVAPVITPPTRFGIGTGTVVGGTSVRTTIGWTAGTDDRTGLGSYDLRRRAPSGWTTVSAATTSTSATSTLTYGSAYTFQLRARDRAGNLSGPADSPSVTPTLHRDSSSLATYGSGWSVAASSAGTNGSLHTSSRAGASMSIGFTGRSIALVAPRGLSRGSVKVYIDDVYASTVSLYRTTYQARVVVFSRGWGDRAPHRVRLVVVGTTGHPRVDVDGFVVVR